ncbi:MAG: hypothetical protein A2096_02220 [Spirochaetes bacterium GWF1_41_5]|nr:MAG: hypothetical protein A2096_02220 [Spirochaetes bacterium GWF1_41_5]HBE04394.1 ATP-dependent DNA helicase RecG [Spirochaetia bacterium]
MNESEFEILIRGGENTRLQFKKNLTNANALALELIAFSNSLGGQIIIGVDDEGDVIGLSGDDISRINQLLSNAASENYVPPIYPVSDIFEFENKKVMIIKVPCGANKPYATKDGRFITRSGADKRMISNDEMRRLFQESGKLLAEETPVKGGNWDDIDSEYFLEFYKNKYDEELKKTDIPRAFENLNLASDGSFNLCGSYLFGKNNIPRLFIGNQIICISFFGKDLAGSDYRDSANIDGNLKKLFEEGRAFIARNIKRIQNGKNFNSVGDPEIPMPVIDELFANALLHRDFFVSGNIRIGIFDDRIEIISPGALPNHLTIDNIKKGVSIKRNPTICSFASDIIPYRGIGSGILRALKIYPKIEFENNTDINFFKATIYRPGDNI